MVQSETKRSVGRPKKVAPVRDTTTTPQLSKAQVLENWNSGLYDIQPELWIPHAIGETLDPWQIRIVRQLFLGEKRKVSVRAGHGSGKCVYYIDKLIMADGSLCLAKDLIGKRFEVFSVDPDFRITREIATAKNNGVHPVWTITTETRKSITRTAEHPLYAFRGGLSCWAQVRNIEVGELVYTSPYPVTEMMLGKNSLDTIPFVWERVISKRYVGEQPTVAVHVPGNETYLTDFVEHNSYLSSRLAVQFLMTHIPSLIIATGPTGKQTRSQFWSYVCMAVANSVFADDIECLATRVFVKGKNAEEWKIIWVTSKEPRTIEGFHGENLLWIVEEAKAVGDPVFESLSGALSQENNYLYVSSTCGPPRGHFFESHTRLRHLYDTAHVPSTESSRVSPEKIQLWKEQWGEDSPVYKARVLAEFPEEDDSAIASLSWLVRAIENPNDDEMEAA